MLFHLDFRIEYAGMTQQDLFQIWAEEADAALKAKEAGVIQDLWKAAGTRRVIVIVDVDGPETIDRLLLDLPIMKTMGQNVHVFVTPMRTYEGFAADLRARLTG